MKLQILPARQGLQWVREGVRLFFRRPLALFGLFMLGLALAQLLLLAPVLGPFAASFIVPPVMLGLMMAAREVADGRFPMPHVLWRSLMGQPAQRRPMLVLCVVYMVLVNLLLLITQAFDDGQAQALLAQHGGQLTPELLRDPAMQAALQSLQKQMMLSVALMLPVNVLFWHAPALAHWHQTPAPKALFFSAVGVLRNAPAYLLYALGWFGLSTGAWLLLMLLTSLLGSPALAFRAITPLALMLGAMVSTSTWPAFRDTFSAPVEK